jgi:hypothetical protein
MLLAKKLSQRIFRVAWSPTRNRFIASDDGGNDLGVSVDRENAIGSAVREAGRASRDGCRVVVMVEQQNGKFRKEYIAEAVRR